jgi:5-methylcytosine-specific restriction endonuclease McrA
MKTNQEIIDAYTSTGSVWRAGKVLGMAGQTVHEKLKALGHKLPNSKWSSEELAELKKLSNQMTIAQIANRLGRPYNGVAIKISRLGIGERYGNNQKKKIPRTGEYVKVKITKYIAEIDKEDLKLTKFSKMNSLNVDSLVYAIQKFYPEWHEAYSERNAYSAKSPCPYCEVEFWPQNARQIYCTRHCANQARVDRDYFGGRRRETIGLLEGVCQLCGAKNPKGLSSHHMLGKENDPDNRYLIALCQGCHQIVTIVAGRRFVATPEAWEVLMQLVIIRKNGANPDFVGVYTTAEIDIITKQNAHLYEDDEI